jgi:uncharacterized membrane protein YoaK (UPF0700 family)
VIVRLRRGPADTVHLGLMLALTFATGIIDAVGYLGLDRVFTGNMTGNVVVLGMALLGADDLPVLGPVVALAGFVAGATAAGRVLKGADGGWTHRVTGLFAVTALVELGVGVALLVGAGADARPVQITVTTVVGAAMGVQAATARYLAVKDVPTVVVTSTLTGLASESVLGSGTGGGTVRRVAAVALILVGAATGAALLRWDIAAGFLAAGLVSGVVTAVGALAAGAVVPRVGPAGDG